MRRKLSRADLEFPPRKYLIIEIGSGWVFSADEVGRTETK